MPLQSPARKPISATSAAPAAAPANSRSALDAQLDAAAWCRASIQKLQAQGRPVPFQLQQQAQLFVTEAQTYFNPQEVAQLDREVNRRVLQASENERNQTATHQRAESLRQQNDIARKISTPVIGDKRGLTAAELKKYQEERKPGESFKYRAPTGRARVDKEHLAQWAKSVGPMLGLSAKHSTSKNVRSKLDHLADLKTNYPDKFEAAIAKLDYPRAEVIDGVEGWKDTSLRLSLAERLEKRDNENKVPLAEEVTLGKGAELGLDVRLSYAEQVDKELDEDPDNAEEIANSYEGEISNRCREDAARDTLRQQQDNPTSDEPAMRDAIIRAFDKQDSMQE